MRDIEKYNPQLAGVLPKSYNIFTSTLPKELLKKVSEIPASLDYDAFGRIYEYFLGEFARTEGQGGGEFYTHWESLRSTSRAAASAGSYLRERRSAGPPELDRP
jgi:type I restriction-modification system DNA methylase subunit